MGLLDEKVAKIREDRLGSIRAYGGTLNQLMEDTRKGCLKTCDRSFAQATFCMMSLCAVRFLFIQDAVMLIHAPIGCSSILNPWPCYIRRPDRTPTTTWISTNLTERDTLYGGEEKLKDGIKAAHQLYHAQSIFVLTSCVSGIIGDDIEGIVSTVQPEVNGVIVPIHCEGFRSRVTQSAYDAIGHAVAKYLVREPKRKQEDMVNIINGQSFSWPDQEEIIRLLAKLGLRANIVFDYATTEQICSLSEAAFSTTTCPTFGDYLMKALEERFGVPYFRTLAPVGTINTERWLLALGKMVKKEKEVEKLIQEERSLWMPKIEELRSQLQGIRVYINGGQTRALAIAGLVAADLGMEVVGITVYEHDPLIMDELENLRGICGDFLMNVADHQPIEQTNILEKLRPDLYLGHRGDNVWAAKQGIPLASIFQHYHSIYRASGLTTGFRGVVSYGNKILWALKNPSFYKKIAVHTQLPFKAEWYEKDPFSNIKLP